MAYVPYQGNDPKLYSIAQGFENGTIFPSLNKPFYGQKCMGNMEDMNDD
ncbi:MAG: spore coat associated protein CotJA [Oscillospiraceae bacterium]|nr:spore coat associated protein CotJA [Oscillospiraceae bacterium]